MSLPPSEIPQGAIRFNTDSQKLEFYAQGEWWNMVTDTPNLGTSSDTTAGARGVFAGGESTTNVIEYINISSTGNAVNFGDLVVARRFATGCSSSTRGLFGTGGSPYNQDIDYITISSTGDAQDFGDASVTGLVTRCGALSNSTRGMWAGGFSPTTLINVIQYVTISSTGDTKDFGDLTVARYEVGGFASPTRGIFVSGSNIGSPATWYNTIDFITIASLGDAQDFGDISAGLTRGACGFANATRGVYGSGNFSPSRTNTIEYITISSLGNGINFGDLTEAKSEVYGACCSPTRGLWAGGQNPALSDVIEYVTINTQGDAVDFGNLSTSKSGVGACSNAHGGL